ncbi:MAG TPA: YMGG-like glycine zipper-containing protein [Gemmatimonadaceae bacterium]|nr:YMGG-like glycine zipper-containing protein [Gemmatimonadaceae bacterium]
MRISPLRRVAALAALLVACGGDRAPEASADSALARDLAMLEQPAPLPTTFGDTAVVPPSAPAPAPRRAPRAPTRAPAPTPVRVAERPEPGPAVAPAPVEAAPAPDPEASRPRFASGTAIAFRTADRICTAGTRPGDKVVATTTEAVFGENGAMIPAGSAVVLEVAGVANGAKPEETQIGFRVRNIIVDGAPLPPSGTVTTADTLERVRVAGKSNTKKVVGGAIAGAILGQVLGKDTKGTMIGAAAGAAVGTGMAMKDATWEGCLPSGAHFRLVLDNPLVVANR